MTESFTPAWKIPRLDCHVSVPVSKYLKSILSRKSLTIPGRAATISGREYRSIFRSKGRSNSGFIWKMSGIKSRAHTRLLTSMAKITYEKSGTGETKCSSHISDGESAWTSTPDSAALRTQYDENQKNSRRFEAVSVSILTVLNTANLNALCS